MGKPAKRKTIARRNLKNARRKLAENVAAQRLVAENGESGYAESAQTGEPVQSCMVVAEDTEPEDPVSNSLSDANYDVVGSPGRDLVEQTTPSTVDANEPRALSTADDGGEGESSVQLDGEQQGEGVVENGPLIDEDSSSERSEYEIKIQNRPISEEEAKHLVSAIEKAQAAAAAMYQQNKETKRPLLDELTKRRILLMTASLNLRCHLNCGMTKASLAAAAALGLGPWAARMARKWIRQFQATGDLPENLYGRWNSSIIEDEDFSQAIQEYLRCKGQYVQAQDVREFFQTEEAQNFRYLLDAAPSIRTAQRWMEKMGFTWGKERRGQFADGHERPDVVDYRMNTYIPAWMDAERRMRNWVNGEEIWPQLRPGERPVIWWFHDESTFYAHDRRLTRWIHKSETPSLAKKGEGASLMVADFVSAEYGWLRRHFPPGFNIDSVHPDERDARVTWRAGNGRDGWFVTTEVCKQLARAIKIVKTQYPNEDHVFVFDNAPSHTKLPEDVPNVSRMTLGKSLKVKAIVTGPSGEKVKKNMAPARFDDGTPQELYYPHDHPDIDLRDHFKGLTVLLQERGQMNPEAVSLGAPPAALVVQWQVNPTFWSFGKNQRFSDWLSTLAVHAGGAAKRVYRDFPMSSSEADLKRNALAALDSVPAELIRKFALRSRHFVHAYTEGLTGQQAMWANKQYKSHRVVTESVMQLVD